MRDRRLKWHHLGLVSGLLTIAFGIYVFAEAFVPSLGLWNWLQLLFMSILPGAVLICVYLVVLHIANSRSVQAISSVSTFILLAAGILAIARWYIQHRCVSVLLIVGCLLPGLLMIDGMLRSRGHSARTVWAIIVPVVVLSSCVVALGYSFGDTIIPCRNVAAYTGLLKEVGDLTSHFPRRIPPEASHVRLCYYPGCMQGGSHFEVRYAVSRNTADADLARFRAGALAVYNGSPDPCYYINERQGYWTASFDGDSLPSDFKVVVLKSEPYHPNSWNHGRSAGVAISLKSNEEIYWADRW